MSSLHTNKENKLNCRNVSIDSYYKQQKRRLFDSNKLDVSPVYNSIQLSSPSCDEDDSPYAYEYAKKQSAQKLISKNFSTPARKTIGETPLKRSGGSVKQKFCKKLSINIMESSDNIMDSSNDFIMESPQSSAVMKILEKVMDIEEEDALSGDFSQKCILPVVKGKHPDLNTIKVETAAELVVTVHDYDIIFIDCRYPYEYSAGHIKGAVNLYTKEKVDEDIFNCHFIEDGVQSKKILIFYCEFSSERAPNMMRFIREKDRSLNLERYPFVFYPEMYLLEGGYKSFFTIFKHLCLPPNYKPMLCKENARECAHYRNLCKSWNFKHQKDQKQ